MSRSRTRVVFDTDTYNYTELCDFLKLLVVSACQCPVSMTVSELHRRIHSNYFWCIYFRKGQKSSGIYFVYSVFLKSQCTVHLFCGTYNKDEMHQKIIKVKVLFGYSKMRGS
jgi:hypothetical protein